MEHRYQENYIILIKKGSRLQQNMAEAVVEQDTDINISCIEEELRQLTDIQISSSSESDIISEDEDILSEDSQKQLQEFAEISQKLLDEFTVLETELTCEEQEPATQVYEENEKLNSIEVQIIPPILCEQPEDVQRIATGDQGMTEEDTGTSYENRRLIEDLKENIQKLSEEKHQIVSELQEQKIQAKRLNRELEDERLQKEALCVKLEKSQNKFLKLNRVSLAVTREYADTLDELELEQNLRHEAESYASKVLKQKKAISRQSMILMQNLTPNELLMKALDDVRLLTTTLEETKQELQTKVKSLELQLSERPTPEEFLGIQENLNVVNTEKSQMEEELKEMKETCTQLEERVKSLEEELQRKETSVNSMDEVSVVAPPVLPQPPPPPPPPPPPCPPSKTPEDPLALIKKKRGLRESEGPPVTGGPDARADAVKEMMERIKSGVILRPARNDRKDHAAVTNKRKTLISELQGILMETVSKPARKASRRRISRRKKDSELDSVLQRRRKILDTPQKTDIMMKTLKQSEKSLEKNRLRPLVVTPLNNEDKIGSEKQIQTTSDLQKSQNTQPETKQVVWQ
ncbi:shootin-1-like [Rhinoderma darwinii]|uniref:shootin-1-like n=1 Tax=Rhinoderma darwinii TaxID=43563 RepID=UPI003F67A14A